MRERRLPASIANHSRWAKERCPYNELPGILRQLSQMTDEEIQIPGAGGELLVKESLLNGDDVKPAIESISAGLGEMRLRTAMYSCPNHTISAEVYTSQASSSSGGITTRTYRWRWSVVRMFLAEKALPSEAPWMIRARCATSSFGRRSVRATRVDTAG